MQILRQASYTKLREREREVSAKLKTLELQALALAPLTASDRGGSGGGAALPSPLTSPMMATSSSSPMPWGHEPGGGGSGDAPTPDSGGPRLTIGGHPTFDMGGGALGHLQVSIVTHSTRRERGSVSQQGKLTVELSFKGQRVNGFLDGDGDTPPTTQLVVLERRSPTAEWRLNVQSEVVVSEGDPEYHATASFQFDASKAADEMHQASAP
jgi:hypothetical protein